jgi:Methyltransferase domain
VPQKTEIAAFATNEHTKDMLSGWRKWMDNAGIYYPLLLRKQQIVNHYRIRRYRRIYPPNPHGQFCCNYCGQCFAEMVTWHPAKEDRDALERNRVIAGYGAHCICPGCLSISRERLLIAAIEHLFKPRNLHILHFAPEEKVYPKLAAFNQVVAADIVPGLYRHIAPGIVPANITDLPFENNGFDMVWANHVLEHVPDDRRAMQELYRVLKPGGTAVLQVPISPLPGLCLEDGNAATKQQRSALFGQNDHVRIYTLHDYLQRLSGAGFEVKIFSPESFAPPGLSIQEGEVLITGQKPLPGKTD